VADFALEIDACKITPTHSVKLLGVTLDRYLTFDEHIDNVVKKCHGLIGALAKAAPYLTRNLLRIAYVSLIRSQMEYCSTFASAAPSQLLNTVQKISARIICGVPRDAYLAPLLESLRLESLESGHTNHIIKIVESIMFSDCNPALKHIFTVRSDGALISSRQPRIAIGKRRFTVFAKELYDNELSTS